MNTSKRNFLKQTAGFAVDVGGHIALPRWAAATLTPSLMTTGAAGVVTGSALLLPSRADAIEPFLSGFLIAVALGEIFKGFGLTRKMLRPIETAATVSVRRDGSFHDTFAAISGPNIAGAWRFDNGKIVGVDGFAYGGANAKSRSFNSAELAALSHEKTLSEYGPMIPVSARVRPNDDLKQGYKQLIEDAKRGRGMSAPDPLYARVFENIKTGDQETVGVFGRGRDGSVQVAWISRDDIKSG